MINAPLLSIENDFDVKMDEYKRLKGNSNPRSPPDVSKTMERRFRSHYKTLLQHKDGYLEDLEKNIKCRDENKVNMMLEILCNYGDKSSLLSYRNSEGETLLHITVKYNDNAELVSKLCELCPKLLPVSRVSPNFRGQTALHIALTKGNLKAVDTMLRIAKENECHSILLHERATGEKFVNTVMMGELPLTVAALKFNIDLVEILLEYGAELHMQNSSGDSLFHTLIKYSAIYPDKISDVKEMFEFMKDVIERSGDIDRQTFDQEADVYPHHNSYVWFLQNKDGLTPLQLSAMHGVSELFEYILNIKDVYYFVSAHDGLFDVKQYDISEIDTISNQMSKMDQSNSSPGRKIVPSRTEGISRRSVRSTTASCTNSCCEYSGVETESILEMLFYYNYESREAFRIIESLPVKNIIKMKWATYRAWFIMWLIFHFASMTGLTIFAVERSALFFHVGNKTQSYYQSYYAVNISQWIFFCLGILYALVVTSVTYTKLRRPNALKYCIHNLEFIIPLATFSVCLITDTFLTLMHETHNSEVLIIALICGWWFNIFFLQPIQKFSFFTEMIKQVVVGDMLRFGVVISFEMIAFTTGMHILFQNVQVDSNDFENYGSSMMAMFKLGIGIGDIEVLYLARVPWAAITLFLLFVIFTYLLMFNALIAMMSQTCALVLEERYPQWRVQQLSVILFLEDILWLCCLRRLSSPGEAKLMVGFDPSTKQNKRQTRYFLEIHSLQMEYATEEDKNMAKKRQVSNSNIQQNLLETNRGSFTSDMDNYNYLSPLFTMRHTQREHHGFRPSSSEYGFPERKDTEEVNRRSERRKKTDKPEPKRGLDKVIEESENGSDVEQSRTIQRVLSKPPDIILSDRSPERPKRTPKRRRSKSENLHEKENSTENLKRPIAEVLHQMHVINNMAKSPPFRLNFSKPEVDIRTVKE